jgi:O-antigen ligase
MSSKRGAILCGSLYLILLIYYSLKNIPRNKKFLYTILTLGVFSIISYYLSDILASNEYLMMRLDNMQTGEDASGDARVDQVTTIVDYSTHGPIFNLLFGYGFDKSVMIAGNYAHNDWAELLANLGIFGCLLYLIFFTSLIVFFKKNKHSLTPMQKLMFISVLGSWLLTSMFSMGYISNMSFLYTMVIAYLVSQIEKQKKVCQR